MSELFDVIVVGVGGFGSAVLAETAKRGLKVLGIEQHDAGHALGSSHGETRIIRRAYFEHPDYVPLLDDAFTMWRELEEATEQSLMELCGLVLAGPTGGDAVPGVRLAADRHGVAVDEITADAAARQFPGLRFSQANPVLYEHEAGYLRVDQCVRAHQRVAHEYGGSMRTNERVLRWSSDGKEAVVITTSGEYRARHLVLSCGAWTGGVTDCLPRLRVLRKTVTWFPCANAADWPVFYIENSDGRAFYGLPGLDRASIKIAEHTGGDSVSAPDDLSRDIRDDDITGLADFMTTSLELGPVPPMRSSVCMYTLTTDGHFVVDRCPGHENVVIAAGFSGHGFKFTPVIGAAIADLVQSGQTKLPVGFLGFSGRQL